MLVRIFLLNTINSIIAKRDGYIGLVMEAMVNDSPYTSERFFRIHANKDEAELYILAIAFEKLLKPCDVEIYTDGDMVIPRLESGVLQEQKNRDWKNTRGTEIKDAELWSRLLEAYEKNVISITVKNDINHPYAKWMTEQIRNGKTEEVTYEHYKCNDAGQDAEASSEQSEKESRRLAGAY